MASKLVTQIKKELLSRVDPTYHTVAQTFFKEPLKHYGVRTPVVRAVAKTNFVKVKNLPKKTILSLCEEMLSTKNGEEITIAFSWAFSIKKQLQRQDFKTLERWLTRYVTNWGACDDFCCRTLGYFLLKFPEFLPKLNSWAKSKNRWMRRASAVALIYGVRRKQNLNKIFEISQVLLMDSDDLVQKGYGWALKEAGNKFPNEVFRWVLARKHKMPRTALRYAIEKYPAEMRKKAMS